MSKVTLNFFGETILTDIKKLKSMSSLRKEISRLFFFSAQDAAEIILTYNKNGNTIIIVNEQDLKDFLKSKTKIINLDINQNSQIYKNNLNQLQEEILKEQKILDKLIKKKEELKKLKETKFISEKKQIEKIEKKILELISEKTNIEKSISEGTKIILEEIKEIEKKIEEIQEKKISKNNIVNKNNLNKNKIMKFSLKNSVKNLQKYSQKPSDKLTS